MNEIKLPDYLPSRYRSWYDLYLEVVTKMEEAGCEINEETTIKLGDYLRPDEASGEDLYTIFVHEFPLTLIKARAFDYIFHFLPTFEDAYSIRGLMYQVPPGVDVNGFFEKMFKVCPKKKYKLE